MLNYLKSATSFIIAQTKSGNSRLKISLWLRLEMVAKKGVLIETRVRFDYRKNGSKLFNQLLFTDFSPIIFISIQLNQLGVCVGMEINSICPVQWVVYSHSL